MPNLLILHESHSMNAILHADQHLDPALEDAVCILRAALARMSFYPKTAQVQRDMLNPHVLWAACCKNHLTWLMHFANALCRELEMRRIPFDSTYTDILTQLEMLTSRALMNVDVHKSIDCGVWVDSMTAKVNPKLLLEYIKFVGKRGANGSYFGLCYFDVQPKDEKDEGLDPTEREMKWAKYSYDRFKHLYERAGAHEGADLLVTETYRNIYAYRWKHLESMTWYKSHSPPNNFLAAACFRCSRQVFLMPKQPSTSIEDTRNTFEEPCLRNANLGNEGNLYPELRCGMRS